MPINRFRSGSESRKVRQLCKLIYAAHVHRDELAFCTFLQELETFDPGAAGYLDLTYGWT